MNTPEAGKIMTGEDLFSIGSPYSLLNLPHALQGLTLPQLQGVWGAVVEEFTRRGIPAPIPGGNMTE
ncbi:hypothetical protein [Desulfovibrio ferrophilus]|nr:hypothetical protein [Desulfovibrio ferrophilus]